MDEGKDSLGTTGAQNADAFDATVQPPTHPANSIASPDSTANNKIISSANLTPPTALSAPLPTDPLHPIQTVGSGKGDLRVGGGRGSKRPFIIGAVVVAISLVIVGMTILLTNLPVSQSDIAESFASYRTLVEDGPEGYTRPSDEETIEDSSTTGELDPEVDNIDEPNEEEINTDLIPSPIADNLQPGYVGIDLETGESIYTEWFLFNLPESSLSETEQQTYLDDLVKKYETFYSRAKHAKSDIKTELNKRTELYTGYLMTYRKLVSLDFATEKLTQTFINDGSNAAADYIDKTFLPSETYDNEIIATTRKTLEDYLHYELNSLELYSRNNCIVEGSVETDCTTNLFEDNSDLIKIKQQQENAYRSLTYYSAAIKQGLYKQTLDISNFLGGTDAE